MNALILNKNYDMIALLDIFESFIWTDRFYEAGDFELILPMSKELNEVIKEGNFVQILGSQHYMFIEDIEIKTDVELGNKMIVTGRSLESVLLRRIIWNPITLDGNFQEQIKKLLEDNVISPSVEDRKIPNFRFKESKDEAITKLKIKSQYFGDNLYDVIVDLCLSREIGFRILPYGKGGFEFELYTGVDRSYKQDKLPYVVFSPKFDNFLTSNYFKSKRDLKTAALIAGEEIAEEIEGVEGGSVSSISNSSIDSVMGITTRSSDISTYADETTDDEEDISLEPLPKRKTTSVVAKDESAGLLRREMFVDASGIYTNVDGEEISEDEYYAQLEERGIEELSATEIIDSFEGEVEPRIQYIYGEDYFIGDLVQVINEYDMSMRTRITEVVRSHDANGEIMIPTFTSIYDEENEDSSQS